MPVRPWGTPVCIDDKIVGSTGSFKAIVFSENQHKRLHYEFSHAMRRLTSNGALADSEELCFVIARDRGVAVDVAR